MSLPPSAEQPQRPHYFWLSVAATVFTVGSLVLSGAHDYAAAGLGLALAVAFFRTAWREMTRRSVGFLAVGIVAYLVAWNRGVPFLYAFSAACFAIVVIAHLLPRWVLRPVHGRIDCPSTLTQGDRAELTVTVENPGSTALRMVELEVPLPGTIDESGAARALLLQLRPKATERITLMTPPLRRGCHKVGPMSVGTGFPLGLVMRSLEVPTTERNLWVYPKLFPVEHVPLAGEQFQSMGEAISPRTGGGDDFAGVREYRHGDSRRSIHWRASARSNKLVVKEFMRTVATTLTIAVDLGHASDVGTGVDTPAEDAIRIAASLAHYALSQRHYVQLALCGRTFEHVGPVKSLADFEVILRALALARCDGITRFGTYLSRIAGIAPPDSTAVLVYGDCNAGVLDGISAIQQQGVLVLPVVIEAAGYVGEAAPAGDRSRGRSRRLRHGGEPAALFRA